MSNTKKIKAGLVLQDPSEFVGQAGTIFYNPDTGTMYLSDGVTPGGISLGQGGGGGGFSGNYNDLTNKPNLQAYANTTYVDNKATWGNITGKPNFSTVATSGSYNDLTNKPTIPSLTGYATESYVDDALTSKVDSTSLALVATSGNYNDLEYLPTISTVGHTGNYEDLRNKPSIPSVVGLATENYVTSQGYITSSALNSTLSTYATQSYVTGQGFVNSAILSSYATLSYVNSQGYVTTSALNSALSGYATQSYVNGQGFVTSSALSGYATQSYVNSQGFITISSLSSYATQSYVNSQGFLTSSSLASTLSDYARIDDIPAVPTKTSDLTNDSGFITLNDVPTVPAADRLVNGDFEVVLGNDGNLTAGNINVGNLALISVPDGAAITSTTSADIDIFTNLGQDNYSEIWLHHGGNVEITTNGNTHSWNYTTTGNLVLPQADMTASPAPALSGIVFSDGTFQNTAATGSTTTDRLVAGDTEVVLGTNGTITMPSGTVGPTQAGQFGFGANTGADAVIKANGGFSTWIFKSDNTLQLPAGGDIVDSTGTSVLGGGGGASTGNITFSDTTMTSTNGSIYIGFEPSASPAVSFSFTDNGIFNAPTIQTGSVETQGPIKVGEATVTTTGVVECLPNVDTIVYTGTNQLTTTIKALFHVEGVEDGTQNYEAQSCEMMVAQIGTKVAGSVYGLAYTSTTPLATFNARIDSSNLIEITCRPTSTTEHVYVRTHATEMFTTP